MPPWGEGVSDYFVSPKGTWGTVVGVRSQDGENTSIRSASSVFLSGRLVRDITAELSRISVSTAISTLEMMRERSTCDYRKVFCS